MKLSKCKYNVFIVTNQRNNVKFQIQEKYGSSICKLIKSFIPFSVFAEFIVLKFPALFFSSPHMIIKLLIDTAVCSILQE